MTSAAHVVHHDRLPAQPFEEGAGSFRIPIDPSVGCRNLTQVVARFEAKSTSPLVRKSQEEVLYVIEGRGRLHIEGAVFDLEPGSAAFVPPGAAGGLSNPGPGPLSLCVVVSPPLTVGVPAPAVPAVGPASIHERDAEALPAGRDRYFKVLIDPRYGCRNVTQFVGFILKSKAPTHTHTYEEAIYILEGEGVVHIGDDRHEPIRSGTSIFLPPGTPHCLENRGEQTLTLLGVFSPPGSPAARSDAKGKPQLPKDREQT